MSACSSRSYRVLWITISLLGTCVALSSASAQNQQAEDHQDGVTAKTGEGGLDGKEAGDDQRKHEAEGGDIRREKFAGEQDERHDKNQQEGGDLDGHANNSMWEYAGRSIAEKCWVLGTE